MHLFLPTHCIQLVFSPLAAPLLLQLTFIMAIPDNYQTHYAGTFFTSWLYNNLQQNGGTLPCIFSEQAYPFRQCQLRSQICCTIATFDAAVMRMRQIGYTVATFDASLLRMRHICCYIAASISESITEHAHCTSWPGVPTAHESDMFCSVCCYNAASISEPITEHAHHGRECQRHLRQYQAGQGDEPSRWV